MPRQSVEQPEANQGILTRFLSQVTALARRAVRALRDWIADGLRRLFDTNRTNGSVASAFGWWSSSLLLYILIAALFSVLVVSLVRSRRGRRGPAPPVVTEAIQPALDVADENVGADQLPVDGWTKLARELIESGDFRLAMRAFYLASLAHLAQRNLIAVARFKSNRDYEKELKRRGHALPEILLVFGENLSVFEGIWYGMREVNRELLLQFAANVDKIKAEA
jgi:hypothetical protein